MVAKQDSRQYLGCRAWDEENKSQIVRREVSTVFMPRILVFLDAMWCSEF